MNQALSRRAIIISAASAAVLSACAAPERLPLMKVYKTASCTCCEGWITAVQKAGFITEVVSTDNVAALWEKHGVPAELSSCHVGEVLTYAIVGHVPPEDVIRLLREKPDARALIVPGMPIGSPGMEQPSGKVQDYNSLLLLADGTTNVFAHHAGNTQTY